jgi:glycerate kinase
VFTGEGRVDAQTLAGKTVAGVLEVARTIGVPVVVFAGRIAPGAEKLVQRGVRDVVCITPPGQSDEQALSRAEENLVAAVSTWLRGFVGSSRAELSR